MDTPLPNLNAPVPLAVSVPTFEFGLMAKPALLPVAEILELTLTL